MTGQAVSRNIRPMDSSVFCRQCNTASSPALFDASEERTCHPVRPRENQDWRDTNRATARATLFMTIIFLLSWGVAQGAEIDSSDPPFPEAQRAAIEAALDQSFGETKAPGVIAGLWIPGQGRYVAVKGLADVKTRQPMRVDDYFRIGSITKTFTGTALLILADERKLDAERCAGVVHVQHSLIAFGSPRASGHRLGGEKGGWSE